MLLFGINIDITSDNNYRIYTHEDGSWSMKGRFRNALEDDDEVTWDDGNGQLTLSICAEGKDSFGVTPVSHAPATGASDPPPVSKAAVKSGDLSKKELVALLNIPEHLAQNIKNAGLKVNYAKYKACLQAQDTLSQKIKQGTWPAGIKKPTNTNIIELFVSRTYWHTYMTPAFHDISHYPPLKEWLENEDGAPADVDVWGTVQNNYSFADLQKEKERRKQQTKGKGKKKDEGNAKEGKKKARAK
jgi:hypothetical protein